LANPNILAYLMLLIWPVVCVQLWTRLDPQRALVWTILGGYLLLPPLTGFDLPVIPSLDKVSIPNIMAAVCAIYLLRDRVTFLPKTMIGRFLIGLYVVSPFATVLTNSYPLVFAHASVPGLRLYDSVAAIAFQAITLLPFFLARKYLSTAEGSKVILEVLVAGALIYSVPMLIESRFSPQMNVWVYGFFQHDFFQTIRQGGYRPVVFLPHGLWVAFFTLMAVLAAFVLARHTAPAEKNKALMICIYMIVLLFVCKSMGPMIYLALAVPLIFFMSPRAQMLIAGVMAMIVLLYPMLRGLHVIPIDAILDLSNAYSAERGGSLGFRVFNEELLLARAAEKPWFGWGGYGRGFLHDPISGQMTTIADGWWVIVLGTYGWFGYIAEFGLTALPLLMLAKVALLSKPFKADPYVAGVALILAFNLVDLLPNATSIPFTWLMAGTLLGHAERVQARAAAERRIAQSIKKTRRTVI
jgi:hypothetical protein